MKEEMGNYETTARGHAEPFCDQFSVFLANRVGQLRELLEFLNEQNVQVIGISIVDSTDWAVVRLVLSDANKGRELLRRHGMHFTETQVLLVELPEDSSLAEVSGHLLLAEINIHFAYPLTIQNHQHPVVVFHVDDHVLATHALTKHGFVLLGEEDLADPS